MAADYTRRLTSERAHGTFSDHAGGCEHQTAADPRWRGARAVRGRRLHAGYPRAALLDGAVTATRTRGSHRGTRSRRCHPGRNPDRHVATRRDRRHHALRAGHRPARGLLGVARGWPDRRSRRSRPSGPAVRHPVLGHPHDVEGAHDPRGGAGNPDAAHFARDPEGHAAGPSAGDGARDGRVRAGGFRGGPGPVGRRPRFQRGSGGADRARTPAAEGAHRPPVLSRGRLPLAEDPVNYAFLPLLAVLTSVAAYVIAVRAWNRRPRALRPALRRALEVIGLASVFLAANLAVGLLIVLLVRGASGRFISAYVLNDTTLVVMSTLQGMLWSFWGHAEDS